MAQFAAQSVVRRVFRALRSAVRQARQRLALLRMRGSAVQCPCCGGRFKSFLSSGWNARPKARCPACGALERHRLLWLYLQRETSLFSAPFKVLHFAPEPHFRRVFKTLPNVDYVTADIDPERADVQVDIRNMTFDDATFDVILCSHVLEHIDDDGRAMRELLRVLKPGGTAFIMTPYAPAHAVSLEDPAVTSPEERFKLFGNEGHVRIYGRDLSQRLREAGFDVTEHDYGASLAPEDRAFHGIDVEERYRTVSGYVHEDVIFRCVRPSGSVPATLPAAEAAGTMR